MYIKLRFLSLLPTVPVYALLLITLPACKRSTVVFETPPHYNFGSPYIIKLPGELNDISGIAYYAKDHSLFAESDEKGCLYKIFLNKPTDIRKWKFSHKRDYEDIVLHDSTFYILNNNGDITTLNFLNDSLVAHNFTFPENGKYEFETLFYDDQAQKLILVCKECEIDKNATSSTYSFDPKQLNYGSSYTINAGSIAEGTGPNSTRFKPSGAAINPATGELFILSSINKLLAVADRNGAIKHIYQLDPKTFGHPEGITFSPSGNLFISNEAGTATPANILYYQFKK